MPHDLRAPIPAPFVSNLTVLPEWIDGKRTFVHRNGDPYIE